MYDVRPYLRLSDDRGGSSITDQNSENVEACEERGWTNGPAYVDPDNSAGPGKKRKRPDFDELVYDLEHGTFGAEILQMWEGSRGSRVATQWSAFIVLCQTAGVKIFITSYGQNGRLFDLSIWEDEKALLQDAISSQDEWHKIQKRITRNAKTSARDGRPSGFTPFGYVARYRKKDGKLDNWYPDTELLGDLTPVAVVNKLFEMFCSGYTMVALEKYFAAKGFLDRKGAGFSRARLRYMLLSYTYIGIREYKDGLIDATWDGILEDVNLFYKARKILLDPSRLTRKDGSAKHLLTGTLLCGICNGRADVRGETPKMQGFYLRCQGGHVHASEKRVDEFVVDVMLQILGKPEIYQEFLNGQDDSPRLREVQSALAKARSDVAENETAAKRTTSTTTIIMLAEARERLDVEILRLESLERELTLPPTIANFLSAGDDLRKTWNKMPLSARRQLVREALTPEYVGTPLLLRGHRHMPIRDRIAWRRVK